MYSIYEVFPADHMNILHMLPASHLEDLVLLQHLSADVEGQVLAIHNALDKVEVLRDEVFTVVHDEHSPNVQLDVVGLLAGVKHVKGCPMHQHKFSQRHPLKSTQELTMLAAKQSCHKIIVVAASPF
jgi:hypothetical protein